MEKEKIFTFKPLKGGKYRCNQNGILTKDCESLRRRLYNQQKMRTVIHDMATAIMNWDSDWSCPHCGRINSDGLVGYIRKYWRCEKDVRINGQRTRPQPSTSYFHWWGN
ncbi:MAG: hypothetical protein WCO07_03450 [bacterium]